MMLHSKYGDLDAHQAWRTHDQAIAFCVNENPRRWANLSQSRLRRRIAGGWKPVEAWISKLAQVNLLDEVSMTAGDVSLTWQFVRLSSFSFRLGVYGELTHRQWL
jgi:hypothetical protein